MSITKAEYDRLMEGRTRPLTDPHMSNDKATKWRFVEEASAPTNFDAGDVISQVIEHRKRWNTKLNVVSCEPLAPTLDAEAEQEIDAVITRMDAYAYRKNRQPNSTDPKDAA